MSEIDAQLEISHMLGYIQKSDFISIDAKLQEVSKMLQGLINSVRSKTAN